MEFQSGVIFPTTSRTNLKEFKREVSKPYYFLVIFCHWKNMQLIAFFRFFWYMQHLSLVFTSHAGTSTSTRVLISLRKGPDASTNVSASTSVRIKVFPFPVLAFICLCFVGSHLTWISNARVYACACACVASFNTLQFFGKWSVAGLHHPF